ncbi:hypothetical protein [Streptomyces sp. NPDC012510]|uniref:hypothetical protein n=1 Tax=Streptomyces sp. NPDC012510 TaxID=3364838 RepID=UPI0036E3DCA3
MTNAMATPVPAVLVPARSEHFSTGAAFSHSAAATRMRVVRRDRAGDLMSVVTARPRLRLVRPVGG